MIKQTAEIFEILSKGGFISSDSTNPNIRQLYTVIEDNQSELCDFFAAINFVLESGNEYYYFPVARIKSTWNVSWRLLSVGLMYLTLSRLMTRPFHPDSVFSRPIWL